MRKSKKAMTMNMIVMMIIALVVLAMMIYLANKYIVGTGKSAGELSNCRNQNGDCSTEDACNRATHLAIKGLGCPETKDGADKYCCIPKQI